MELDDDDLPKFGIAPAMSALSLLAAWNNSPPNQRAANVADLMELMLQEEERLTSSSDTMR